MISIDIVVISIDIIMISIDTIVISIDIIVISIDIIVMKEFVSSDVVECGISHFNFTILLFFFLSPSSVYTYTKWTRSFYLKYLTVANTFKFQCKTVISFLKVKELEKKINYNQFSLCNFFLTQMIHFLN